MHFCSGAGAPPGAAPGVDPGGGDPKKGRFFVFSGAGSTPRVENGEVKPYIDSTDPGLSNGGTLVQKSGLDRKLHRFENCSISIFSKKSQFVLGLPL